MRKAPNYTCVQCGVPREDYCRHFAGEAPGWCSGTLTKDPKNQSGHHELCPGHAKGHEPGSCPCSCHGAPKPASKKEIETAMHGLLKMQRELEEVNHAEM